MRLMYWQEFTFQFHWNLQPRLSFTGTYSRIFTGASSLNIILHNFTTWLKKNYKLEMGKARTTPGLKIHYRTNRKKCRGGNYRCRSHMNTPKGGVDAYCTRAAACSPRSHPLILSFSHSSCVHKDELTSESITLWQKWSLSEMNRAWVRGRFSTGIYITPSSKVTRLP